MKGSRYDEKASRLKAAPRINREMKINSKRKYTFSLKFVRLNEYAERERFYGSQKIFKLSNVAINCNRVPCNLDDY